MWSGFFPLQYHIISTYMYQPWLRHIQNSTIIMLKQWMYFIAEYQYKNVVYCCMAAFVIQWQWMYPVEKISSQNTYPLVWHSNCHHIGITSSQYLYSAHQLIVFVNGNIFKWGLLIWMDGLVGSGIEYIFACWKSNKLSLFMLQIEADCKRKNLNS